VTLGIGAVAALPLAHKRVVRGVDEASLGIAPVISLTVLLDIGVTASPPQPARVLQRREE
jgi:hypothetical protein